MRMRWVGEGGASARPFAVLAALALGATTAAACLPPSAANGPKRWAVQSDLPITRVVLYRNGVGYFERRGRVRGDVLHLRIRHDQVMDVLKSLTVVDTRGGGTVTVSLPAERSRLLRLSQLPPQVRRSGGLLAIAAAFRGARAVVHDAHGVRRGRLVGVENLGTAEKPDWRITLLSGETLSSHQLASVRALRVLDRTLTVGLEKSLDMALSKGRWKPVRLTVRLSGRGPHDLIVSYVIPMPTWKPAYRLVLGNRRDKEVLLQGWAVVDNLSGEGWVRARLSLTAGTPLAFRYDLYTPRIVQRPDLTPRHLLRAEAPPPSDDATAGPGGGPPAPKAARRLRKGAPRKRVALGGARLRSREDRWRPRPASPSEAASRPPAPPSGGVGSRRLLERAYEGQTRGKSVGSLFRYDVQRPVTLPDRSTSLVSLVSRRVPGEDILYFLVGSGRVNPYRAVRFENRSGFVLERGPVTIYREGTFVGEALGGRVARGAVAFVPYALEGRVIVHLSASVRDEGMRLIRIRSGYVTVQQQSVTRFTYKVTDRTGESLALWVARERRPGWKILFPKDVILEKRRYYSRIPLKPRGVTTFTVKEARPVRRSFTLLDSRARRVLAVYLKGSEIPGKLRAQLEKVQRLQDEIARLEIRMSALRRSISMLRRRQADIRANLRVLGKRGNRDLRRRLLGSLTRVEAELTTLNREWVVKNLRRGELRQRLQVLGRLIRL